MAGAWTNTWYQGHGELCHPSLPWTPFSQVEGLPYQARTTERAYGQAFGTVAGALANFRYKDMGDSATPASPGHHFPR